MGLKMNRKTPVLVSVLFSMLPYGLALAEPPPCNRAAVDKWEGKIVRGIPGTTTRLVDGHQSSAVVGSGAQELFEKHLANAKAAGDFCGNDKFAQIHVRGVN